MIPVAEDLVVIPIFELDDFLRLILPSVDQNSALAFLVVKASPIVVFCRISLIAAHYPVRQGFATELNSAVVIAQLHLDAQNEVLELLFGDQKGVAVQSDAFGGADDHAVVHFPQPGIAVPTI